MVDIRDIYIESSSLQATRRLSVFIPKDHRPGSIPVLFCADGQAVDAMSASLALAIDDSRIPPVALVGVHSSADYRAQEYLVGVDDMRFEAHERFFTEEVPQYVESELGVSAERQSFGVFGFSNGGAFAVSMGLRHRDRYGVVIAFSVPRLPNRIRESQFRERPIPCFYLAAGTKEKPFRKNTMAIAKILDKHAVSHAYYEREAGHDVTFWERELRSAIRWAFSTTLNHHPPLSPD